MSVIRQPGVLGQRTERRLAGITSALSASVIEALAVGTWFALVVVESRTVFTALAGLGVLLFGSLLRSGVVGSVGSRQRLRSLPLRLASAVTLATCWVLWLYTAETVGGVEGVLAGGGVLVVALAVQFTLERRAYYRRGDLGALAVVRRTLVPSVCLAAGASTLLAAAWFVDATFVFAQIPVGDLVLELGASSTPLGFVAYGLCSFLAQQRRIQWLLTS